MLKFNWFEAFNNQRRGGGKASECPSDEAGQLSGTADDSMYGECQDSCRVNAQAAEAASICDKLVCLVGLSVGDSHRRGNRLQRSG